MPQETPARAEPTKAEVRPARAVKKTPEQWALELGHLVDRKLHVALSKGESSKRLTSEHRRAATAHKWDLSNALGHAPIFLTEAEYRAALVATTAGSVHEPAIAPAFAKGNK